MKDSYHIEYDLPFEYEGDFLEEVKQLAGYMDYIMDDIIHDLGIERYELIFYHMVHKVVIDRIIKLERQDMEAKYK